MKKIVYSLLVVLGVFLLAGCGKVDFSKTSHISCKKTEDKASETTTTTMMFTYNKDGKINDFQVESDTTYKTAMSKEVMEITAKAMKLIGKPLGLGFKSEVSENRLYFSFSGNIKAFKVLMKQLNKDYKEELVTGDTKEEALSELAKDGYTCEDIKK